MICSKFEIEPGLVFLNTYKLIPEEVDFYFFGECDLDVNGKVEIQTIPSEVKNFCLGICHNRLILIRKFRKIYDEMDPLLAQVMKEFRIKEAGKVFLLAYEYAEEQISHNDVEEIFFSFSTLNFIGKIVQPEIPEEVATYCQALLDKKVDYAPEPIKKVRTRFFSKKKQNTKSAWNLD